MALSKAAIRAIAIRRSVAAKAASNDNVVTANDNTGKRTRRMGAKLTQACVDAAGFAEHAAR